MIEKLPSRILTKKCSHIETVDNGKWNVDYKKIYNRFLLRSVPHQKEGVGIAGSQVGIPYSIFSIKDGKVWRVMMNPTIEKRYGTRVFHVEGCLSIPKKQYKVERYTHIDVTYRDINWNLIERTFTFFEAQIFQHEFDHLQGTLINKGVEV